MAAVKEYFHPKTKQKYPIGGCIISNKSPVVVGASPFRKHHKLPPSVDLRRFMTSVEYQGQSNTCSANAVAGLYEFLTKRLTGKDIDVSRLFIYYNGRLKDGYTVDSMQDAGATLYGVIRGMQQFGCCKESIWRYLLASINRRPSYESYSAAKRYLVTDVVPVATHLHTMKSCLAEGFPFVFGLKLFKSFHRAATNKGRVPIPSKHEPQSETHGWHALVAVGYTDRAKAFIVRNSWGKQWGDNGYCYIPYVYMTNSELCRDCYAIRSISNKPPAHRIARSPHHMIFGAQQQQEQQHKSIDDSDSFDEKQFWTSVETFNFYFGFESKKHVNDLIVHRDLKYFLIWIDDSINDLQQMVRMKLDSNEDFQIISCKTLNETAEYLLEYDDLIRSRNFQIISRSYFPNENKSALHLLEMLDDLQLSNHLPISIITKNLSRIECYFNEEAPHLDIYNWKQKLFVTDQIDRLVYRIQYNFTKTI